MMRSPSLHERLRSNAAVTLLALLAAALPAGLASRVEHRVDVRLPVVSVPIPETVTSVHAIGLTVSDADRSIDFYTSVLEARVVDDTRVAGSEFAVLNGLPAASARIVTLQLGEERLQLLAWDGPAGRPAPQDGRGNDLWFQHVAIIVSDIDRAFERLQQSGVQLISLAPQRIPDWNTAAAGIRALYFRDPDGHPLEILWFPPDKGDARWHVGGNRLFLGIDHTAIAVSDTESSLRLYRDLLGLAVAGGSLNYGPEQERLSGVPGARVRITALRAASGPGIEFLEYLSPEDGRPAPTDQRPNDLVHWQTVMATSDAARLSQRLAAEGIRFVSSGMVRLPDGRLGYRRSALLRDPDGHAVQLVEVEPAGSLSGPPGEGGNHR